MCFFTDGCVITVVVQYETTGDGKRMSDVRDDNHHVCCVRSRLDHRGDVVERAPIEGPPRDGPTLVASDLKANWRTYRKQFLGVQREEHDGFTLEDVALFEERVDQATAFLQDVLESPAITEVVPSGSEVRFQEVVTTATTFHIVAFRPEDALEDPWVARVIKPLEHIREHRNVARAEDVPNSIGNPVTRPEVGTTAEAALEALAAKLLEAQPQVLGNAFTRRQIA